MLGVRVRGVGQRSSERLSQVFLLQGLAFRVSGLGIRVSGFKFRGSGFGFDV